MRFCSSRRLRVDARQVAIDGVVEPCIGAIAALRLSRHRAIDRRREPLSLPGHPSGHLGPRARDVLRRGRRRLEYGVGHLVGEMRVAGVADRRHDRMARAATIARTTGSALNG